MSDTCGSRSRALRTEVPPNNRPYPTSACPNTPVTRVTVERQSLCSLVKGRRPDPAIALGRNNWPEAR